MPSIRSCAGAASRNLAGPGENAEVRMNERTPSAIGWRWLPLTAGRDRARSAHEGARSSTHFELYERLPRAAGAGHHRAAQHGRGVQLSRRRSGGWQRWFFTALALGVGVAIVVWLGKLKARSQGLLACSAGADPRGRAGQRDRPLAARARRRFHPRALERRATSRRSTSRIPRSPSARRCCCSMRCLESARARRRRAQGRGCS